MYKIVYVGKKEQVYTVMVTTPQEVSLLDVRKEISFANKVGLNVLGIIENMSGFICPCCHKKSQIFKPTTGGAKVLCKQMNIEYLGSIPIDQLLLECCENGKSFLKSSAHKDINNSTGTRVALLNVIKQITSRIDGKYAIDIEEKENYFKNRIARKQAKKGITSGGSTGQSLFAQNNLNKVYGGTHVTSLTTKGNIDIEDEDSDDSDESDVDLNNNKNPLIPNGDTEMKANGDEVDSMGVEADRNNPNMDQDAKDFVFDLDE